MENLPTNHGFSFVMPKYGRAIVSQMAKNFSLSAVFFEKIIFRHYSHKFHIGIKKSCNWIDDFFIMLFRLRKQLKAQRFLYYKNALLLIN